MTTRKPIPAAYATFEACAKRHERAAARESLTHTAAGLHAYWLASAAEMRGAGMPSAARASLDMAASQRELEQLPPYGPPRAEWRSVVYDDADLY